MTVLALYLGAPESRAVTLLSHVLFVALSATAAVACWGTSRRRVDRWQLSWRLLACGAASWSTASVVWWVYPVLTGRQAPFPSVADGFYLLTPLLITAGLVISPRFGTGFAALRAVIDGVMAATALLVVVWPISYAHGFGPDALAAAVSFAYPAFDVLLIVTALAVWLRLHTREPRVPTMLVLFAIAQGVTDGLYGIATTRGTYATGQPLDLGWHLSFSLLIGAALLARRVRTVAVTEQLTASGQVVPLLPVAAAMVSLALTQQAGRGRFAATVLVIASGALRQYLLARDHAQLAGGLEHEVQVRSAQLAARERAYAGLVHNSSDVIAAIDEHGIVTFVSDAVEDVFGHPPLDVVGRDVTDLVHPDDLAVVRRAFAELAAETTRSVECRMRHVEGGWLYTECRLRRTADDTTLANIRDMSGRRVLEEKLRHLALTDSVTGLASRAALVEALDDAMAHRRDIALLFLDLDDFKVINDTAGHTAGDQALREVAARLNAVCPPLARIARLGGDEFAVALVGVRGEGEATALARRILDSLAEPIVVVERPFAVGASIGIATTEASATVSDLLRYADLAMYDAKHGGKNQIAAFTTGLHDAAVQFSEIHRQLREALDRDEFVVHYQPIVSVETGALHGFEALVRWNHPERGTVAPAVFLPVAEETALIAEIGARVLEAACAQLAAWHAEHPHSAPLSVAVNLDPQQLVPELVPTVLSLLDRYGVPAESLTLEITERAFERHDEAIAVLLDLKRHGLRLALDDFGTGYSSLSRLHDVPIDRVKIDRSFVSPIGPAAGSESPLATSAIALCQAIGVDSVAEGVETPEQLRFLQATGCQFAQGYLFSRPLPAADATTLVAEISASRQAGSRRRTARGRRFDLDRVATRIHGLDRHAAVPLVLNLARQVARFDTAYLTDIDLRRSTQHLREVVTNGDIPVAPGLSVAWSAALCREMLTRDLEFVPDVGSRFPDNRIASDLNITAFACIPVRAGDDLLGTLCVADATEQELDQTALEQLHQLADLLAEVVSGRRLAVAGARADTA